MVRYHISLAGLAVAATCLGFSMGSDLAGQEKPERAAIPDSTAVVEGTVVDHESGDSLKDATVSLGEGPSGLAGRGTRVTDETGRFRFLAVPAGAYTLLVTAAGYRSMRDTLEVGADSDLDLILPLSTDTFHLAPIIVTADRPFPSTRAAAERRLHGRSGFLVTREEIERRQPRFLTELLHRVPGGMVLPTPPEGYTLYLRDQCRPGIWLDGVRLGSGNSIDQLVTPQEVEAVEVYHAWELPVEFGVNSCGGVLIWTRRGTRYSPRDESEAGVGSGLLEKLAKAAAIVLVVVILTR